MLDDLTIALNKRTAHIIAARFQLENERHRNMSRLSEKLAAAAAVAPRQAAKIEARADAIIASESEIETLTDDAFAGHEALLDEARKGVQDLKHELATMSNNPPLEPSTTSPAGPRVLPDGLAGMGDLNLPMASTDRVALGPHPDQPEVMPETTEGAIWIGKPPSVGNAAKAYDEAVKFAEVEQKAVATFRAAE